VCLCVCQVHSNPKSAAIIICIFNNCTTNIDTSGTTFTITLLHLMFAVKIASCVYVPPCIYIRFLFCFWQKCTFTPYILELFWFWSLCFIMFHFSPWFFEQMLYLMRKFKKIKENKEVRTQMNLYPKIKD
jgi:hypothetical protein